MRCIAFDSKEFKRVSKSWDGDRSNYQGGFFTPLGVGVEIDNPEEFTEAYLKAIRETAESFSIKEPGLLYSFSALTEELGRDKATAFAQLLINSVSKYVSSVHFCHVILSSKEIPEITVGGNKCPEYKVKTEDFMRNLNPMFSYLSAWAYQRYHRNLDCKLLIDSFRSKETIAWKELSKNSNIVIVPHGDDVNPLISFADVVVSMTDVKLYRAEPQNRTLNLCNLKTAWEGVFDVHSSIIGEKLLNKVKWVNEDLVDFKEYVLKPTVFFMSDDPKVDEINKEILSETVREPIAKNKSKSKRLMELQPVRETVEYATLHGYSFQFFDPYTDSKNVCNGDVIVYMGDRSRQLATYYEDGFDIEIFKAKEIRKHLKKFA